MSTFGGSFQERTNCHNLDLDTISGGSCIRLGCCPPHTP